MVRDKIHELDGFPWLFPAAREKQTRYDSVHDPHTIPGAARGDKSHFVDGAKV